MNKTNLIGLLILLGHCALGNDLTLWYDKPAVKWDEALPLGNGRLGAMVFGGFTNEHL